MPYTVKGKCIYKKDGGAKVGCTKGNVKKYLAALHANASESITKPMENTKELIKRLIRENLGVFNENSLIPKTTFRIKDKNDKVGTVVVGQLNNGFGKDTLEILNVYFNKGVINLEIGKKTLLAIFDHYPEIQRIVIQPNAESRDFWYKLDAQRVNDDYMIIFRAH